MLDKPDPERDNKLSKHIMKLHNNLHNPGQTNKNSHLKRNLDEFLNSNNNQ